MHTTAGPNSTDTSLHTTHARPWSKGDDNDITTAFSTRDTTWQRGPISVDFEILTIMKPSPTTKLDED